MNFLSDPVTFLIEFLRELLLGWGLSADLTQFILFVIGAGLLAILPMLTCLILIWAERKLLGRFQDRIGPNRLGPFGLIQPIADMLKIFTKEYITPKGVDWLPFNLAPVLSVAGVLLLYAVLPITSTIVGVDLNVGVLYLVAVGGFGALGFIFAGWGSNNKYALLGAFRAIAQLISYEIPVAVCLLIPVMLTGSLKMTEIVQAQDIWFILLSPLGALIYFISSIAEIGRSPFDLLEADSELVSGFNIEYSGLKFGMFYVADFLHAFTLSIVFATLFLGGWRGPFAAQIPILGFFYLLLKTVVVWFIGIWIRGSMPRIRIDHMLSLSWKVFTPLSLAVVMLTAFVDKLLPFSNNILKAGILFIVNIVVLLIMNQIIQSVSGKKEVPQVAEAQPENAGFKKVSA